MQDIYIYIYIYIYIIYISQCHRDRATITLLQRYYQSEKLSSGIKTINIIGVYDFKLMVHTLHIRKMEMQTHTFVSMCAQIFPLKSIDKELEWNVATLLTFCMQIQIF